MLIDPCSAVSFDSAVPKGIKRMAALSDAFGIKSDHINMTKFSSGADVGYQQVLAAIKRLILGVDQGLHEAKGRFSGKLFYAPKHWMPYPLMMARESSCCSLPEFLEEYDTNTRHFFAVPNKHGILVHRQSVLQDLFDQLMTNENSTGKVVLSGSAGVGKTQIALEYAYLHGMGRTYSHVFWLRAESHEALMLSLWKSGDYLLKHYSELSGFTRKQVARIFGLETIIEEDCRSAESGRPLSREDIQLVAKTVLAWFEIDLEKIGTWLLIYDGVRGFDAAELSHYMPLGNRSRGHIMVTIRNPELLSMAAPSETHLPSCSPSSPKLQYYIS